MRPARHVLFRALDFGLFRHLQGVVDLDPQVPHGGFQLRKPAPRQWAPWHHTDPFGSAQRDRITLGISTSLWCALISPASNAWIS
jgi:hypothetical protein